MGSLQGKVSWLFTFLLGLSTLVVGASALAQTNHPDRLGPDKGRFDWTQFEGKYDFSECRSRPSAIWGDSRPDTFVQIDHKVTYERFPATEGLELMRANYRNPIALGWSVERVGQGRQTDTDADTGKVDKVMESYATRDGVYGMMAWDHPNNVGWSTLQLRMDAQSNISFTLRQRANSDAATREETCTLKKYVPKIRA
jgi:hypothetical protein